MKPIIDRPDIIKDIRSEGLYELITDLPRTGTIVEIGCLEGQSSEIFALTCDHVTCVDPWKSGYDDDDPNSHEDLSHYEKEFDKRMSKYKNYVKAKLTSLEATRLFAPASLDFVYLDGAHTYTSVKADIEAWLPKIASGGAIGGHDFSPDWFGVIKAVQSIFQSSDENRKSIMLYQDTSWLVYL